MQEGFAMKPRGKILCILCLFAALLLLLILGTPEHEVSFAPDMTLKQFALLNDMKAGKG